MSSARLFYPDKCDQTARLRGIFCNNGKNFQIKLTKRARDEGEGRMRRNFFDSFAVALICISLCLQFFTRVSVGALDGATGELFVESRVGEDGIIELSLRVSSKRGICGIIAELEYNADGYFLLACGLGEELSSSDGDFVLSYAEHEGKIRFLVDGVQNTPPECTLAVFYFGSRDGADKTFEFFVGLPDREHAFSLSDGELERITLSADRCRGKIKPPSPSEEDSASTGELSNPKVDGITVKKSNDGSLALILSSSVADKSFAAGFKVFVLNVGSGESQGFTVAGVISRAESGSDEIRFWREIRLGDADVYCVVITPISYTRANEIAGEKTVVFVDKKNTPT